MRTVAAGSAVIGRSAVPHLRGLPSGHDAQRPFPELTQREFEVLDLVASGATNAEITRRLVIAPKTVRNQVHNVMTKLGMHSRSELVVLARTSGLGQST